MEHTLVMGEGTGGGFTEEVMEDSFIQNELCSAAQHPNTAWGFLCLYGTAAAAAEASPPLPPLLRCRVSALSQATPGLYQTLLIPELTNEDPEWRVAPLHRCVPSVMESWNNHRCVRTTCSTHGPLMLFHTLFCEIRLMKPILSEKMHRRNLTFSLM